MLKIFQSLSHDILAIDFGSNEIKASMIKTSNDTTTINYIDTISTPRNAIKDGKIIDMDKVIGVLSLLVKRSFIGAKFAVATVQSSSVMTRELILPVVGAGDVEGLIKFEIENRFPIDANKFLLEYIILEKFTDKEGLEKIKVFVSVMPREIVQGYYDLFKLLKLTPYAMDFNSNSLSKLFKEPMIINNTTKYDGNETIILVDLGVANANVTILKGGNLRLSRLVPLPDDGIFIKSSSTNNWINDIDRVIQYYLQHEIESTIQCIYIHGGGAKIEGIDEEMSKKLDIPIYRLKDLSFLRRSIIVNESDIGRHLNTIGAAIRFD